MKTILSSLLFITGSLQVSAQDCTEIYTYFPNLSNVISIDLPNLRPIYGGTKIVTDFEGDWSKYGDMMGAFNYACKIWEEAMPTTLPIHIKVRLLKSNSNATSQSPISKVMFYSCVHEGDDVEHQYSGKSLHTQIKAVCFDERYGHSNSDIYAPILNNRILTGDDMVITYYIYQNHESLFSFSLDSTISSDKYDFVTIALRDIAKGFGINWSNKFAMNNSLILPQYCTPYEKIVTEAIDAEGSGGMAYSNATQGTLVINDGQYNYTLYAPNPWKSGMSLDYFVSDASLPITQLLDHNFGKGTLFRNINSTSTYYMFRNLLHWQGDVLTGNTNGSTYNNTIITGNVIPYQGNISRSIPTTYNMIKETLTSKHNYTINRIYTTDSLSEYIQQFNPFSKYGDGEGWTISVLKKDGTWDEVYRLSLPFASLNVNMSMLNLEVNDTNYARTCDGYLRGRISYSKFLRHQNGKDIFGISTEYVAFGYTPDVPDVEFSKYMPFNDEPENYNREVKLSLSNIEGVTHVSVAQLDEWDDHPFFFDVPNFKDGCFYAIVDRDYTSTFTVTYYNENGSSTSEELVVNPQNANNSLSANIRMDGDHIIVLANTRNRTINNSIMGYNIIPMFPTVSKYSNYSGEIGVDNKIDISKIEKGMYILRLKYKNGSHQNFKFQKQ